MRILILATILFAQFAQAQSIKVTASSDRILIGDHLQLIAEINSGSAKFDKIDFESIDTSSHFELINPGEAEGQAGQKKFIQKILVTSFDSGIYYLPPLTAIFKSNGEQILSKSNPIPISIGTVPPDSLGLAPLKDIIEEEATWEDYLMWMLIPLLLLILALIYFWWRRRKEAGSVTKVIEVYVPPHERALNELEQLEQEKLWQQGDFKKFEVRISTIFRRYLEDKFNFPALEWTTREIVQHLSQGGFEDISVPVVQEVLKQSDMVKYAKVKPGAEAHGRQISLVREWILSTKNYSTEEE